MIESFPSTGHHYDIAIIGAGITGCECALACAKAGLDVLLVTTSLDTVYNLLGDGVQLNPHAGTFMAQAHAELANEQGFTGNWAMHRAAKFELEHTTGIHFLQSNVSDLIVEEQTVTGFNTWEGVPRYAKHTALCVGSFLEARLKIGTLEENAGRLSEMTYDDLYHNLTKQGLEFESLKLNAEFEDESLPYSVSCKVLKDEVNDKTFGVNKLAKFYAAGVCAFGFLSYEDAALQGQELAQNLVTQLSRTSP